VNPADRAQLLQVLRSRRDAIADSWHKAIARTSFVPLNAVGVRRRLLDLTDQAITLLTAESFEHGKADAIGAALARLHCVQPETLGRTQEVLARQLVKGLPADQSVALQPRLVALLGGVADGFFRQARETILAEQEQVCRALITHLRQMEEKMGMSEQTWRVLLNAPTDPVLLIDPDGTLVALNQAMANALGKGADELVGTCVFDQFSPDVAEHRKAYTEAVLLSGEPVRFEDQRGARWFESSVYPVFDARGKVAQVVVFARDVTTRKQMEKALRKRAAQLALLNDIGGKIAGVLQLDSLLDRAVRLVQESFGYHHVALFIVDLERGELVMRARAGDYATLFPRDHRIRLDQGMVGWVGRHGENLLANDVRAESRYVNFFPDLIPTQSELSVPIQVNGELLGVLDVQSPLLDAFDENDVIVIETLAHQVAVAIENARLYEAVQQELVERKQMEQYLLRTERLAAMGHMAAALAHEINNPLQAIRSNLELALDFGLEPGEREEYLHIVRQEIERLAEITRRVRSFAQPPDDTRYSVGIAQLVEETLALVGRQLKQAHVRATTDLPPDLPAVYVAPTQIVQVLVNLVINAIEAMPDGGHLHVTARVDGGMLVLSLTNDGPPIPPEYVGYVFDAFFTTKPGGTGLGLAISDSIVRKHGGTISVENLSGDRGVAFHVTMPTSRAAKRKRGVA
jgi:two-component system sensor histidine kinase HydH